MPKPTNTERKDIYRRDGFQCGLCGGTRYLQIHHYIRRGAGGRNDPMNLISLCCDCHGLAHGFNLHDYPDMEQDWIEQGIVEYLADNCAPEWWPWD